ncbi:MAG: DUF3347 domain-containing protein [Myxococcales bacterium]|nr:DUF3347 domain-containing protein [Myxococcales bacterium]
MGPGLALCGALMMMTTTSCGSADDGTLLTPYLAVGEALAKDELPPPPLAARIVEQARSKAGEPGTDALADGAAELDTADLPSARAAFQRMSAGMIESMKADPKSQPGHVIVHCPMTFGGKGGLWVQRRGKIANPYEGSRMLRCGDIVDWGAALPET